MRKQKHGSIHNKDKLDGVYEAGVSGNNLDALDAGRRSLKDLHPSTIRLGFLTHRKHRSNWKSVIFSQSWIFCSGYSMIGFFLQQMDTKQTVEMTKNMGYLAMLEKTPFWDGEFT